MLESDKKNFLLYCSNLPDGNYYLIIKKEGTIRTLLQNSYYWVLMTILGNELAISKDEAHDICGRKFLSYYKGLVKLPITKSTASLNKWEFVQYIDEIRVWAAISYIHDPPNEALPFSINLPSPMQIEAA